MRSVCLAPALLLTLAGCGLVHVPTDVSTPGMADTDKALRESIARVNQSMNEMGDKGASFRQPTTAGAYVPAELQRPVSAALTGSLDSAAQALAERVGYRFASNATPSTTPLQVSLPGQPMPVIDLFRSLGAQAGQRADVRVNADQRQVEVRYHG